MLLAAVFVAQEEAPPPLIDLDGTLLVQFILFIVMLVVLSKVLFKPYLKLRADREHGIDGAKHKAHEMETSADKMVADYEAQLQAARLKGAEERAKLRAEGAARERQILGAARDEAQRTLDEARGKVRAQAETARKALEAQAATLAKQVTRKILGREVA
jgi:F-type H+-transporting ATPase subunit b